MWPELRSTALNCSERIRVFLLILQSYWSALLPKLAGSVGVRGSNPLSSTPLRNPSELAVVAGQAGLLCFADDLLLIVLWWPCLWFWSSLLQVDWCCVGWWGVPPVGVGVSALWFMPRVVRRGAGVPVLTGPGVPGC
jgi:hypothetical protein